MRKKIVIASLAFCVLVVTTVFVLTGGLFKDNPGIEPPGERKPKPWVDDKFKNSLVADTASSTMNTGETVDLGKDSLRFFISDYDQKYFGIKGFRLPPDEEYNCVEVYNGEYEAEPGTAKHPITLIGRSIENFNRDDTFEVISFERKGQVLKAKVKCSQHKPLPYGYKAMYFTALPGRLSAGTYTMQTEFECLHADNSTSIAHEEFRFTVFTRNFEKDIEAARTEFAGTRRKEFVRILGVNINRIIYLERVILAKKRKGNTRFYLRQYDIKEKKSTRISECLYHAEIPMPVDEILERKKHEVIFNKEGEYFVAEVDFLKGTCRKIVSFPRGYVPWSNFRVPGTRKICFPTRKGPRWNAYYSLHVFNLETGEIQTVLDNVSSQVHPEASFGPNFQFQVIDENSVLYIETVNPYEYNKDGWKGLGKTYDRLMVLHIPTGRKTELANLKNKKYKYAGFQGSFRVRDGSVYWQGKLVSKVDDIIYKRP